MQVDKLVKKATICIEVVTDPSKLTHNYRNFVYNKSFVFHSLIISKKIESVLKIPLIYILLTFDYAHVLISQHRKNNVIAKWQSELIFMRM